MLRHHRYCAVTAVLLHLAAVPLAKPTGQSRLPVEVRCRPAALDAVELSSLGVYVATIDDHDVPVDAAATLSFAVLAVSNLHSLHRDSIEMHSARSTDGKGSSSSGLPFVRFRSSRSRLLLFVAVMGSTTEHVLQELIVCLAALVIDPCFELEGHF